MVCVVNYSGYFVARWSVLLIIRDLFGAPVCVVTYSGYFLRAFCIINYSCFFVRWSVLLILRGIFCALVCVAYRYTKIFKTAQKLNALPVPCYAGFSKNNVKQSTTDYLRGVRAPGLLKSDPA